MMVSASWLEATHVKGATAGGVAVNYGLVRSTKHASAGFGCTGAVHLRACVREHPIVICSPCPHVPVKPMHHHPVSCRLNA